VLPEVTYGFLGKPRGVEDITQNKRRGKALIIDFTFDFQIFQAPIYPPLKN